MQQGNHTVPTATTLQFTVLYIFTRELILVLLLFLSINSEAGT